MYFSFALMQKKRYQKKKSRLHFRGYSDTAIRSRGSNSLRSNNRPLPAPDSASADAPTVRPGDLRRGSAVWEGDVRVLCGVG